MDPAHPFPFVSNLSLNLLVSLRYSNDSESLLARVKVPVGGGTSRFVRLGTSRTFVDLADVMANNLDLLFPGMEIEACRCSASRATRSPRAPKKRPTILLDDDRVRAPATAVRAGRAPAGRARTCTRCSRGRIAAELGLDEVNDVFEAEGMLGQRDVMEIRAARSPRAPRSAASCPRIRSTSCRTAASSTRSATPDSSCSRSTRTSRSPVGRERFLREASDDPKVRAIKMTLYRTSPRLRSDHRLSVRRARSNGKQVAVVRRAEGALRRSGEHPVGRHASSEFGHPRRRTAWSA